MNQHFIKLEANAENQRLDQKIAQELGISRSKAAGLIKSDQVKVSTKIKVKPSLLVPANGREITISLQPKTETAIAEELKLEIVYEDSEVLVVNKPPQMVSHPDHSHKSGTLLQAFWGYLQKQGLSPNHFTDLDRPGLVHRLDQDTSGVIILAKNPTAQEYLQTQFKERQVKKTYLALTHGQLKYREGTIDSPLTRNPAHRQKMTIATGGKKGRAAVTHFQVRQSSEQFSFLEVEIETGRTHQIRVHLEAIGHPLVLDPLYGNQQLDQELIDEYSLELKRIFLHSWKLEIKLPNSKNPQTFEAKLPMDLRLALENLQKMHQG